MRVKWGLFLIVASAAMAEAPPPQGYPPQGYPPQQGYPQPGYGYGGGYGAPTPSQRGVQVFTDDVFKGLGGSAPEGPKTSEGLSGTKRYVTPGNQNYNQDQYDEIDKCRGRDKPMEEVRKCADGVKARINKDLSDNQARIQNKQLEPYRNTNSVPLPDLNSGPKDEGFGE